jgi:hypothetical protein
MTNYLAATRNRKRGKNKKDGATGRRCPSPSQDFEAQGFTRLDWNKWTYTWSGEFPVFRLAPGIVGLQAGLVAVWEDRKIFFPYGTQPKEIKARLDDEILAIMRYAAAIVEAEIDWPAWEAEGLAIDVDRFMVSV